MTWAIVGATGQLGQAFVRRLGRDAIPLDRRNLDLTNVAQMRDVLGRLKASVVVNCAAYNWVDRAEVEREPAFAANCWGVADLARTCSSLGCVFVHYSTNYVFGADRERRVPYSESDLPGPISLYGASKLAGEHLAAAGCERHFIIRTAAVFGLTQPGTTRPNFIERMVQLAREGKPLRVVNDQVCSPTGTDDLAEATLRLVETDAYGLYHITSSDSCSWYELARSALELAGVDGRLEGVTSAEFGAAAPRPFYSVMAHDGMKKLGLPPMRSWREMLREYLDSACQTRGSGLT